MTAVIVYSSMTAVCLIISNYYFLKSSFTDPGYLLKNVKECLLRITFSGAKVSNSFSKKLLDFSDLDL